MRESLGTVRLHRFTCDVDGTQVEHRSRASGSIPMPPGWVHLKVDVGSKRVEGDVCSSACAGAFAETAIKGEESTDAPAK